MVRRPSVVDLRLPAQLKFGDPGPGQTAFQMEAEFRRAVVKRYFEHGPTEALLARIGPE